MEKIPNIIKENGFDFSWDEKKVWNLSIKEEELNIKDLLWHLKLPFWNYNGNYYNLKPIDVINNPSKFEKHYERIIKSDINYPIDIMFNKGKWTILDGLHRLVKLQIIGENKIKVRKIDRNFIKDIKI